MALHPVSSTHPQHTGPSPDTQLRSALNAIQEEYNAILADRDSILQESRRIKTLFEAQDAELDSMRQAVQNLKKCLETHRQHFEEERLKLLSELECMTAGLTPSSPPQRLSTNPSSFSASPKQRVRRCSNADDDLCKPKRIKSDDGSCTNRVSSACHPYRQRVLPPWNSKVDVVDAGHSHGSKKPPTIQSLPASSPSSSGNNEKKPSFVPSFSPSIHEDLTLSSVPQGYRKEYSDWTAIFNPKFVRNVDVDLVWSISQPSVICSVHFSPDGRCVATGCNKAIYIYDIRTGAQVCSLTDPVLSNTEGDIYIRSVRFSPDGQYLAAGAEDMKVRIWNIRQRTLCDAFSGHSDEIYALDYSQNGQYVVSGSADCSAVVWDLHSFNHRCLRTSESAAPNKESTNAAGVTSISISSSCTYVAGGCLDYFIRIWSMQTGELRAKLVGHENSVYAVRFMNDMRGLVSGSLDCSVKFWDVSGLQDPVPDDSKTARSRAERGMVTCPVIKSFIGHRDFVLTVACSSDNRYIVSGAKDRSIFLWDSVMGSARFRLNGHTNSVISVDLHGSNIATAGGDMCCRIWSLSTSSVPRTKGYCP
ncbi:hypothetical protein Ac2012v2_006714 [Leucoagaricus gongylophorus]